MWFTCSLRITHRKRDKCDSKGQSHMPGTNIFKLANLKIQDSLPMLRTECISLILQNILFKLNQSWLLTFKYYHIHQTLPNVISYFAIHVAFYCFFFFRMFIFIHSRSTVRTLAVDLFVTLNWKTSFYISLAGMKAMGPCLKNDLRSRF